MIGKSYHQIFVELVFENDSVGNVFSGKQTINRLRHHFARVTTQVEV